MRVISGLAKGRRLITPLGFDIRPTSGAVKEAMMSIIQFEIPGAKVADLCAGTGQLGIEAISRGAESCVFVDSGNQSLGIIRENIKLTGFEDKARVVNADLKTWLEGHNQQYHIVLVDPPYNKNILPEILDQLAKITVDDGIIVCESNRDDQLPNIAGRFELYREYFHGKRKITTYKIADEE